MIQKSILSANPRINENSFESEVSHTKGSYMESESSASVEGSNPWRDSKLEKENMKVISNVEQVTKKSFDK